MAVHFPNASRHYNISGQCVRFRGYDAVFEIAFDLETDALLRLDPNATIDEASLLSAFDENRPLIESVASHQYARRRQSLCRLTADNFARV